MAGDPAELSLLAVGKGRPGEVPRTGKWLVWPVAAERVTKVTSRGVPQLCGGGGTLASSRPPSPADPEDHQGARPGQRAAGPLSRPEPPLPLNPRPRLRETTVLHRGLGGGLSPVRGSQVWCSPPGVPPLGRGGGVLPCHWAVARGNANEAPGAGRELAEPNERRGSAPGRLTGRGGGECHRLCGTRAAE